MKKKKKPKHQNLNLELNGLHFVEFTQNIPLIADGKVPEGGHHNVFSPFC
jgi:hypothetical protein